MNTPRPDPATAAERIRQKIAGSAMYQWLNLDFSQQEDHFLYHLGFQEAHIGNPVIRAIHGGVVSAFMDSAAWLETFARLDDRTVLKTTSIHTSYLRSSKAADMTARVRIHRLGRRFGFLEATSWQQDETSPVAVSEIGIRIIRPDE